MIPVKIKRTSIHNSPLGLPQYQTPQSAGVDLYADISETIILKPRQRKLIPTGIAIELPAGHEAQIRPRSGLALKHGISMVNTPGTIDADYRGEISVILINHGEEDFEIRRGERIAQMVIASVVQAQWVESSDLSTSQRGTGGFGSTGK